jgi:hypothetical protein
VRQVVHHLADTEIFRAARLRQLLAEDKPHLPSFDEATLARRLHYERPVETSLRLISACIDANLSLLAQLRGDDWSRGGTHSQLGSFSIGTWLERAAWHPNDHLGQLQKLRAYSG